MVFSESTNFHDAIAPGQEIGKAERQLDAAIASVVGGGINSSGLTVIYIGTNNGVVQNSTSELTMMGSTGVGSLTLPADFFAEGVTLRFTARGYYSSLDGGDNVNIRLYLGATELADTTNFTPSAGGNQYWEISGLITCRSAGATGTVFSSSHISLFDGAGVGMITTAAVTVDTTGTLDFDLTAQWDTADLDNTFFCSHIVLEKMQVGNSSLSPADVVVGFNASSSSATTNAATHNVDVDLTVASGGQIASPVTVNWSATNVTGTSSGTLTFPAGSSNGAIQTITLTLDYTAGDPVVTLSSVSSNATLGTDEHTVTIVWAHAWRFDQTSGAAEHTTYGNGGFARIKSSGNGSAGSYSAGVGWIGTADPEDSGIKVRIYRDWGTSFTATDAQGLFDMTLGGGGDAPPATTTAMQLHDGTIDTNDINASVVGGPVQDGVTGSNQTISYSSGGITMSGIDFRMWASDGGSAGSVTLKQLEIGGTGINPFA